MWKSMPELSDNIENLGPAHAILRGWIDFEILSLNLSEIAWAGPNFSILFDNSDMLFHMDRSK